MHLMFTVVVVLFSTSVVTDCSEHFVSKHGVEPKHDIRRRDLSIEDAALIFKTLMAKLEHGAGDSEIMHKKMDGDKGHFSYGSEMMDKTHLSGMEADMKYLGKSQSPEHEYMKDKFLPLEKEGYGVKTDAGLTEKDLLTLMMKMKDLGATKGTDDMYKMKGYHGTPDEKLSSEKAHFTDFTTKEMSGKKFEDVTQFDKASDKDVSLAESLYHMSIAGDVETYPSIKMESLKEMYDKKMADEKLYLEDTHSLHDFKSDESFVKKVDEIGKSLVKEETFPSLKDDNIEEYLKKVEEKEKSPIYEPKINFPEKSFGLDKTAEEMALDKWKISHKDLFAEGEYISDDKFKMEGGHHADEGGMEHKISEELLKKLKTSLGMEGTLVAGQDELFHLAKELYKKEGVGEEGMGHEISEELLKKLKTSLGMNGALGTEHDELLHLAKELYKKEGVGEEGMGHEISEELLKKLKTSLGMNGALGTEHDELLHLATELHKKEGVAEGSHAYEIAKEIAHKDVHAHLSDEELKKHIDDSLAFGDKDYHGTEFLFEKGLDGGKSHVIDTKMGVGVDKSMHGIFGDEALKSKELHGLGKGFDFEEKEKAIYNSKERDISGTFGAEAGKTFKALGDKDYHGTEFLFEKGLDGGKSHAIDTKIGVGVDKSMHGVFGDEALKSKELHGLGKGFDFEEEKAIYNSKARDISGTFGAEASKTFKALGDKDYHGTEFLFEKGLDGGKSHAIDTKIGVGVDKSMHGVFGDEALKSKELHGLGKGFDFEREKAIYNSKAHDISGTFGAEADKAFTFHEDGLKKEKAYGMDDIFHKDMETAGDHKFRHGLKDEEEHLLHDSSIDKHHISVKEDSFGADKSPKILHDLKAKFFQLLTRVLRTKKCHLVTMRPGELLGIVNCISKSKDPMLCGKFSMCEKKMPVRAIAALEKCQQETIPGEIKRCTQYSPLYPTAEIPLKIFQCMALSVGELAPVEKKEMIDFEECARAIKAESCGRFKWFRGPH